MKLSVSKKLIKPGRKSLALFSRLTGLGIAGFSSHQPQQKEENIILEKSKLSAGSKKTQVVKFCQNQQHCRKQLSCKPGKKHSYPASIDLWFYLSSQS